MTGTFLVSFLRNSMFIRSFVLSISIVWLARGAILVSLSRRNLNSSKVWLILFLLLNISFITRNFFSFYILFELSLVPILLIILFWGNQPERLSAGLYFLIYTARFSIPYLVILLILNISFSFFKPLERVSFITLFILAPFLVKIPVTGIHFWLPKAHVEARTTGSIILAGILLKLGSYGVYRVITVFSFTKFLARTLFWRVLAILARLITIIQSDLKKLVAYSRVTHITFLIVGLRVNNKNILFNCLRISLIHGWVSIGIFFTMGIKRNCSQSRIRMLTNNESKFHWLSLLFGLILIINAALPPFPSFLSELFILRSGLSTSFWLALVFLFYSLFVCYYNVYLFIWSSHSKAESTSICYSSFKEIRIITNLNFLGLFSLIWIFLIS